MNQNQVNQKPGKLESRLINIPVNQHPGQQKSRSIRISTNQNPGNQKPGKSKSRYSATPKPILLGQKVEA